jgi:hypothetical protein
LKKASLQKKVADAIGGSIGMQILIGILGTPGALIGGAIAKFFFGSDWQTILGGAIILDLIIFAWLLAKAGFFEDPPKGFGSTVLILTLVASGWYILH